MDAATWGRVTFLLMLPIGILVTGWVWIGRLVLGSGGWFMVIFTVTLVPLMLVALLMSWIIALQLPERPRRLTAAETLAQVATWFGAFGFGLFIVDYGDTADSASSVFSNMVGNSDAMQSWSMALAGWCALVTAVGWIVLVVLLLRRLAARRLPFRDAR